MAIKGTVAAVDVQYVEQLEEDYVGYKNQYIWTMVEQIQTWYFIRIKEKLAIEAYFLKHWIYTPDSHIKTFARQLNRRHVKCEDHGVTVTKADKVDHFVAQMYACNLSQAKFLDN